MDNTETQATLDRRHRAKTNKNASWFLSAFQQLNMRNYE